MPHSKSHSSVNHAAPHHTEAAHHTEPGHHHPSHHGPHVHVMSLTMLFTIFAALIFFTIATVVISKFNLGPWEIPITMAIATTKATLVAVYFMHLRYDNPFHAMIFCFSLFFVGLFLGGTLIDVRAYQKDLIPFSSANSPAK